MKINIKKSLLAIALGLSVAGASHAGTIYVSGSTAMRSIFYATCLAPGAVFSNAPTTTLYQGGTTGNNAGNAATYMAFVGTLVGGSGSTTIDCAWSGSEAGIADVATGQLETFLDPTVLNGQDNGTNVPTATVQHASNLAMADTSQLYSRTTSPVLNNGTEVGVITFKWVRNPGLWTGTNVTDSMIRQALGGYCKLAVFSGTNNAVDTNTYVYVSGRDNSSGTRVNAYGDTSFGIFTIPNQIEMNKSGVMQDLNSPNGVYAGDYGYSSGGTLAGTMGANTTTSTDLWNGKTGFSVIAYLSVGDAATAITAGATECSYNGVTFSPQAVKGGTYTFWGNEYLYQANSIGAEAALAYKNLSATNGIPANCDGVKAIALTQMQCTRTGPTTDPVHP